MMKYAQSHFDRHLLPKANSAGGQENLEEAAEVQEFLTWLDEDTGKSLCPPDFIVVRGETSMGF